MNSRVPIIGGNWKMNLPLKDSVALATTLCKELEVESKSTEVVLFPTFPVLTEVGRILKSSKIELGGQNLSDQEKGALTGEISGEILASVGCTWVLVGHSERRRVHGESDALVHRKLKRALASGLRPLICVGESLEERDQGRTKEVIERQVSSALESMDKKGLGNLVMAYEPVWAIGTGRTASPRQAQEAHLWIRNHLKTLFGNEIAESIRIQYGGSVNSENAKSLFDCPDVDGALVGGASLRAESFMAIIQAAGG